MKKLEETHETSVSEYNAMQNEKTDVINKLNSVIESMKLEHEKYIDMKEKETKSLIDKIQDLETNFTEHISQKEEQIVQTERSVVELKKQLDELQTLREKEKADTIDEMLNKDNAFKVNTFESGFQHLVFSVLLLSTHKQIFKVEVLNGVSYIVIVTAFTDFHVVYTYFILLICIFVLVALTVMMMLLFVLYCFTLVVIMPGMFVCPLVEFC